MAQLVTLRAYKILRKVWSRAGLILAFSCVLVAAQNPQSTAPLKTPRTITTQCKQPDRGGSG